MEPVVAVSTTLAMLPPEAQTASEKVVPPEFVTVSVPMSVPMAPLTVTMPVTLMMTSEAVPDAVPATLARFTAPLPPLPSVSVTLSESVAAPRLILPAPAFSRAVCCILTFALRRLRVLLVTIEGTFRLVVSMSLFTVTVASVAPLPVKADPTSETVCCPAAPITLILAIGSFVASPVYSIEPAVTV